VRALRFLVVAVAATPVVVAASIAVTSWWYNARYLPRIAGAQ
jgi:hypothetical protein